MFHLFAESCNGMVTDFGMLNHAMLRLCMTKYAPPIMANGMGNDFGDSNFGLVENRGNNSSIGSMKPFALSRLLTLEEFLDTHLS